MYFMNPIEGPLRIAMSTRANPRQKPKRNTFTEQGNKQQEENPSPFRHFSSKVSYNKTESALR